MCYFTLSLNVVLASYKVPHEIPPIHIIELVVDEELQIFEHRGLDFAFTAQWAAITSYLGGYIYCSSFQANPIAVLCRMCRAVNARE